MSDNYIKLEGTIIEISEEGYLIELDNGFIIEIPLPKNKVKGKNVFKMGDRVLTKVIPFKYDEGEIIKKFSINKENKSFIKIKKLMKEFF